MPYIHTKTNTLISAEKEAVLKTEFGKAISLIPGKSEQWLMLDFTDNERIWLAGDNSPAAMLEVEVFGKASDSAYDLLTEKLTDIISAELGIESSRVYVKYDEIDHWGWNSANF